jgi:hypothetical protein
MNDEQFFRVIKEKDDEIAALRDILRRLGQLGPSARGCFCTSPSTLHSKACVDAREILKEMAVEPPSDMF